MRGDIDEKESENLKIAKQFERIKEKLEKTNGWDKKDREVEMGSAYQEIQEMKK